MGGSGGSPGAGSDGGNGSSQTQGTEYTLQGAYDLASLLAVNFTGLRPITLFGLQTDPNTRCHAILTDRMASARA